MRLSSLVGLAALAFAVGPLGCAATEPADEAGGDSAASADDELRSLSLTEADDGKTVTVTKGQNILVKLQANPTTGYKWVVASTDRTFGYPSSDRFTQPRASADTSAPVGGGGLQRLTWKTSSVLDMVGSHTVKLEYKRPWETNVAPAKAFTFTVIIVDAASCPTLSPPAPGFCSAGSLTPRKDANGCTTGYDCTTDSAGVTP
jgi:inhibitor of cysteine peptidase